MDSRRDDARRSTAGSRATDAQRRERRQRREERGEPRRESGEIQQRRVSGGTAQQRTESGEIQQRRRTPEEIKAARREAARKRLAELSPEERAALIARKKAAKAAREQTGAEQTGGEETGGEQSVRKQSGAEQAAGAAAAAGASAADTETAPGSGGAADAPPPTSPPTLTTSGGRRWGRAHAGRGLVALLSVAVLVCTGYAWNSMTDLKSSVTQLGGLGLSGTTGADGATDILLVGTDSRTDAKGNPLSADELKMLRSGDEIATNTDTILLIRIPNDGSSATAISIPRDSYVDVPGIGKTKINAAYGTTREGVRRKAVEAGVSEEKAEKDGTQAGRQALIDTVANLTGVQVDHYAEVGLLGFVLLTNAVDGVDVCLKNAVREPLSGARFRAGRQTLNGTKALSFVRQRHDLPRGDLDRITRQQVFMASLAQKVLSANTLADPGKLQELEDAVSRSVVIDDNWDILKFVEQLKDLTGGKVKFATIPVVTEQGWSEDGQQSVVEIDPAAVKKFTEKLLGTGTDTDQDPRADYTVDVVNAGTVDGLAANVSNILVNKGFQAGKSSTKPINERDSIIFAPTADDAGARQLSTDLGGVAIRADSSLPDKHLRAVLTNTYYGPGSIVDTGAQTDNKPASKRKTESAPITAGTDGPVCVN